MTPSDPEPTVPAESTAGQPAEPTGPVAPTTEPTVAPAGPAAEQRRCPNPACAVEVPPDALFCEECGAELSPTDVAPAEPTAGEEVPISLSTSIRAEQPAETTRPEPPPCRECGGEIGEDGYCQTCGAKAPRERDHYTEQPASWAAAVCDRGIRHHRNEDASAIAADPEPGSRAVLVVCDGVSTSPNSDVASLAAARAARDVLVAQRAAGMGTPESRVAALAQALSAAAVQANAAVLDQSAVLAAAAAADDPAGNEAAESANAPSCTFVAAVLEGELIMVGNVGDSRAYWIPDPAGGGEPLLLSQDDSVAQVRIAAGVPREEAENGPQAHAITKWLGKDSPDVLPRTAHHLASGPGWLLVCSDGLWNYASEPAELQQLITELSVTEPLPLAEALVKWACDQGGKDNITVALARHEG